jgi:hypothetical protein
MMLSFNQRVIDWAFDYRKHLWHIPALMVRLVAALAWFTEAVIQGELNRWEQKKKDREVK